MKTCLFAIALGLASAVGASAPEPRGATAALTALQAQDLRVASIAYRLATAGAPLCHTVVFAPGLLVQDLAEFSVGVRPVAAALFHLERGPAVEAVVPDSPAARAGVAAGDRLVAINGTAPADLLASRDRSHGDYDGMTALVAQLHAAFARGPVTLSLDRSGHSFTVVVAGVRSCASDVELVPGTKQNASADGKVVLLSTAVAGELDDTGLAFLIAHEMSHNILGHRARLDEAGVSRGLLAGFGHNAAAIRLVEEEADYHALFLMARARYDPGAVAPIWRSFERAHGAGLLADATHLKGASRARFLELAAAQIAGLVATGRPILPDLATVPALANRARDRSAHFLPRNDRSSPPSARADA